MSKYIVSAVGLSGLLLLGTTPRVVAHEGHDHGAHHQSGYQDEDGETGRYNSSRDDEQRDESYDDDEEDDAYRSSTRRAPGPDRDDPVPRPRDQRSRPW